MTPVNKSMKMLRETVRESGSEDRAGVVESPHDYKRAAVREIINCSTWETVVY